MAQQAVTFSSYDAVGNREDLTDVIYDISPVDTPFMSNAAKGSCQATFHEWQIDELDSVDSSNYHVEGDDIDTYDTAAATTRLGNYTQISRKTVLVSGTQEVVNKAGRKSELRYQTAKKAKSLKRDLESMSLANNGAVAGNDTTARETGSLLAFLYTNIDYYTTDGDNPSYTSAPTDARTDGTQRTFTETILKSVVSQCWTSGANPRILMVGAFNKQTVSGFSGIAETRVAAKAAPTTIIGAADIYVSDFGNLDVVPNRFMRARDALVLDPEMYSFCYLRPFKVEDMAKTGDGTKKAMLVEWLLKVHNEAGLGLAADLTTS